MDKTADKNRLFWASRRGMLELDLLLMPFLEKIYPTLSEQEQHCFHLLLKCEDQDLFSWFINKENPENPDLLKIVEIIRQTRGQIRDL